MGQEQPTASRTSTFMYVARLVASIVVPVALIGSALWWVVAGDQVDRAVDQRAQSVASLVDLALEGNLAQGVDGRPEVIDREAIDRAVRSILEVQLGSAVEFRVVAEDGEVLYSNDSTEFGIFLGIELVDSSALHGEATGRLVDGESVQGIYSVPVEVGGVNQAAARVDVADDETLKQVLDDSARLIFLFGGALLAVVLALVPLCWWSLGEVRRQFRATRILAMSDNLTGLANRTQFHQRLDEAIAGAERSDSRIGLVMIDLDGFKAINDTGGHAAGDQLLKRVAGALGEATRRHEIACRLGGDEFAVLAPRIDDRDELVGLADRLHKQLDLNVPFSDGRSLRVTASLGLALYPDDAASGDDLVNKADAGMYSVKASRKSKLPAEAQARAVAGR
jgi:diguanylate cyclase (GGDEF)-like protein